jgi:hypothetical protein
MKHRIVDNFIHQLRAARASTPQHDELAYLYDDAMEKLGLLADGLYKKSRRQVDEINATM